MRRAFTLIELLVVIAIIAILAAILFPVFAAAKASAKAAADLSNVKEHATSIAIYTNDFDDLYPEQSGYDSFMPAGWAYNYMKLAPYNWPDTSVGGIAAARSRVSKDTYMNAIQPYLKNWDICVAPGAPKLDGFHSAQSYTLAAGMVKYNTTYAYNGLLTSYSGTVVVNPAVIPIITEQNGFGAGVGVTFPNPNLTCNDPTAGCRYKDVANCSAGTAGTADGSNGQTGAIYGAFGNPAVGYWCNKHGANWAFCDGHAKYRMLGATLAPHDTDWHVDPVTQYAANGTAGYYWWDGCHPWLYRPDYNP